MPKQKRASDELEEAMQDALESVERLEKDQEADRSDDLLPSEEPMEFVEIKDEEPTEGEPGPADDEGTRLAELEDRHLRLAADFENFRKRVEREKQDLRRYGSAALLEELLLVVDNLERALQHAGQESPVAEGVRMVYRQFLDGLARHGVQPFESKGDLFDPEYHEAVSQVAAPGQDVGAIVEELQRGYMLHERLLRPARVVVAAEVDSQEESEQDAG